MHITCHWFSDTARRFASNIVSAESSKSSKKARRQKLDHDHLSQSNVAAFFVERSHLCQDTSKPYLCERRSLWGPRLNLCSTSLNRRHKFHKSIAQTQTTSPNAGCFAFFNLFCFGALSIAQFGVTFERKQHGTTNQLIRVVQASHLGTNAPSSPH